MPAAVIGRERELDALSAAAMETAEGRGCVVFLSGPSGSGKTALLNATAERVEAATPQTDVVQASCYEATPTNPLGPFHEILATLGNTEHRGDRARRVIEIVGQIAPPLLATIIPGFGAVAGAGAKAASDVGARMFGEKHDVQQAQRTFEVAAVLRRIAADRPLVLVLGNTHWLDPQSREVVERLADGAEEHALTVVLAYDSEEVGAGHPIRSLRTRLRGRACVRDLTLGNLSAEAIDEILVVRYGARPAARLGAWLHDRTQGNPQFLVDYLVMLEEQELLREVDGVWSLDGSIDGGPGGWRLRGRLAELPTPNTLLELVEPRLTELGDDQVALLRKAALQGPQFLTFVLARVAKQDEDDVLDRLKTIADRRVIEFEDIDDWWSDLSDRILFDPVVLQELLYGREVKTRRDGRDGHRRVAEALVELVGDTAPRPRHALLEIARHYELAAEHAKAAELLVEVSESTFAEGADRETAHHAGKALELLGTAGVRDGSVERERLFARAALLLLLGGEPSWRTDTGGGERLFALADDAKRAAETSGDLRLQANASFATAQLTLAYRGLEAGVAAYREALALAQEAEDAVAEFAVLLRLGHQLDSVDLRDGAMVLEQARELMLSGRLEDRLDPAALALEQGRLDSTLGVAKFDLGEYGEAWTLLESSVRLLSATRLDDDYAWALCFLGQLQTALGLWDEAAQTLEEAIAVFEGERSIGARGYFRSLLGRIGVEREPQQLDVARREIEEGRQETHAAKYVSVEPLVDVYWAELLLAEGTEAARREADELLAVAPDHGWARAEVAMGSLRARIALEDGRLDDALRLSSAAYGLLSKLGGFVPAVRSEEIVFTHARVLEAVGSGESADRYAEAAAILRDKAESLQGVSKRDSLLHRVRLSREILAKAP